MKVVENKVSDGKHTVLTSVDITMDNGEVYRITEVRPTASTCLLSVRGPVAVHVLPIQPNTVHIGRY